MIDDLVKRLRDSFVYDQQHYAPDPLVKEAADTIERLTAERDEALVALRELAAMPEGGEVYWRIRQLNALADKARSILAKHERQEP